MRSKKILINIITTLISQVVAIIYGLIVPKLIISKYSSSVNGLVASITQFLGLITLLEAGFGPVIKSMLFKPIANGDKTTISKILRASEKIFRIISYIFIVYIIILCIFLPLILKNEFNNVFTISLIIIISLSTFVEYYFGMTCRLFLQADQRNYIVSIMQIGTLILNTVAVLVLIMLNANIHIVKLASAFIYGTRPIILNIYVKKRYKINLKHTDDNYKINKKWDGLIQHIAFVIHDKTDVAILTICGNLVEVSVYSVYSMIVKSITKIIQSFAGGIDSTFGDMLARNEKENINKKFKIYECYYFTIATIIFSSTLFLIVPFVELYTRGVKDANYIRPVFAWLLIFAELVAVVRQPYNDLIKVAGYFKETRFGAWIETVTNIVISFALVWKLGIVGVAVGTFISISIRAIDFVRFTSKHILQRSTVIAVKNFMVIAIEIVLISIIMKYFPQVEVYSYGTWILKAICVCAISSIVVCLINACVYRDSFKFILNKVRRRIII